MSTFISHSTADDNFVRDLRQALADQGVEAWIDSRQLKPGDLLWPEVQRAIEAASAFIVVVSLASFQSDWVGEELAYALQIQKQRPEGEYKVVPILLDGVKLGAFKRMFAAEPAYIPVNTAPGGIEAAMDRLLAALGRRRLIDVKPPLQPEAGPLEDLVLELTDLKFHDEGKTRRASARARLVYKPATVGAREIYSTKSWRFIAPIGPIEAGELAWYLEKYSIWPSHYFRERAKRVEENLVTWGKLLYEGALPHQWVSEALGAWRATDDSARRRFSVFVDTTLEEGATEADETNAKESATALLGLPWELLHDGKYFIFQGTKPARVRRRIPANEAAPVQPVATPIRILLITARPENEACGYIDHRASALPLVAAMEALPGLVELHLLSPATLPQLSKELDRAREAKQPYHVVHFDGHGVYNRRVGLGGLCFELPADAGKPDHRRHETVYTDQLGGILRQYGIPLVFLDACETAQAEKVSDSVASELLKAGVASVVGMSHSVLVETSRRFVAAFYDALAHGSRVGDAMLAGQKELKTDSFRGQTFGAGELRLQDWFVPVLFQEKEDPQLFTKVPARQTVEDYHKALQLRMGNLPEPPETTFIGRSRDLLALQRLLGPKQYVVIRGQGGEGKTTLAAELARWLVRSQQVRRAAFVSVEQSTNALAVLDVLGRQIAGNNYSAATFSTIEEALQPIEQVLREQPTLLVIDNMESILLPPFMADATPEALSADAKEELQKILGLCRRLGQAGDTRLVFTSREPLPAPFADATRTRELRQLDREDAIKLVERTLNAAGGGAEDAQREEIEQLVDAVNRHARTLALLAPALRARGVAATRASLTALMAEMERNFPGSREKSVYASVELSLRRLSPANRERVQALGVFHGGFDLDMLRIMMEWTGEDAATFAAELLTTGLATPNNYGHYSLNPALCPYLRGQMDAASLEALTTRWIGAMLEYVEFLYRQQNIELASTLTLLELPNLFALLTLVERAGDPEQTISLTTKLQRLLQNLGKPKLLAQVGRVRDAASKALGTTWNHARFEATGTRIEQQLTGGELRKALAGAQELLLRSRDASEQQLYEGIDYDLATACWLLGRVLRISGGADQALSLLHEARQRFEAVAQATGDKAAAEMASACLTELGDCCSALGRLDEAAASYEEGIDRDEKLGGIRDAAVGKMQLATVRLLQRRYPEALDAYKEALAAFTKMDEDTSVATIWHQIGRVHAAAGNLEAAEDAYRKSLAINVQMNNIVGQAATLGQLGNLYDNKLHRIEEAIAFYNKAADLHEQTGDITGEGRARNNLGNTLRKLGRYDDARREMLRAIECKARFGHASEPWTSWDSLADIEHDSGHPTAAAEARQKAVELYLAYRRDGGENHNGDGRIVHEVTAQLMNGNKDVATSFLQGLRTEAPPGWIVFIDNLQAIVAGSRDRSLANHPDFSYRQKAEILYLQNSLLLAV